MGDIVEVRCSVLPLVDRFREHLRDVEKNNTDASKPLNPLSLIILPSVTAAGKPCDKGQSHATDR